VAAKREMLRAEGKKVFECEQDDCFTMQFLIGDSRLCISDAFGRNKTNTRAIQRPMRWCRKHYQRASHKLTWPLVKTSLILDQLERIEEDDPGTTYDIALSKSEVQRLSKYNNDTARGRMVLTPGSTTKNKEKATIPVLQHIYTNFCGTDKTKSECEDLIHWCRFEMTAGRMTHVPGFEMVPNLVTEVAEDDDLKNDGDDEDSDTTISLPSPSPVMRMRPVTALKGSSPFDAGTPSSRISRSGAIKKP
jgi:hypothetical protein